ncbi:hypothetical protein PR048_006013, partial [Dryococelus australis]
MYDIFKESHPNIKCLCSSYRNIFRSEFKLRFGPPRSDSCSYCHELYIHLVAAEIEDEQKRISAQSTLHHRKAETAYKVLHEDVVMSKSNPTYIVLCTDMQQFSTYNQCAHNMGTEIPFMFVWNESVAKRGSSEVTSCILKCIELHFEPLKVGEVGRLVVWTYRCVAQNNNWRCIALYHYLIVKKYFTTIDQKFLVSGYVFLPCNRDFALIERRNLQCIIQSSSLKLLLTQVRHLVNTTWTKKTSLTCGPLKGCLKSSPKNQILSERESPYNLSKAIGRKLLRPLSTVLPQLYEEAIAIKKAKKKEKKKKRLARYVQVPSRSI